MATLGEVGELVTTELRERVDRLASAIEDEEADLADVARLAGSVGELAGTIDEIYRDLEQMLMRGLGLRRKTASERAEPQQRRSEPNGTSGEDVTKDELLEQAREANVQGRSTMSKDELAEAVGAEQSLTKDELLERAREAGIEGRSSMTKEELRNALQEAGT